MTRKEYVKAYNATYRVTHKDEIKTYRSAHKKEGKLSRKKYKKSEKGKAALRRGREKLPARYHAFLRCAKQRKYRVEFSFSDYLNLVKLPCFYCGGSLPAVGSGIDRVDSKKGYNLENVRPCCTICNVAKSTLTENEFREWVIRIFNYWGHI